MSMRLYHRRSSAYKDRLQVLEGSCFSNPHGLQVPSASPRRDSIGYNRQRSQSLFPGSNASLAVPCGHQRSRSASFSGPPRTAENSLTASEEEHIFQCYTRVMYIFLGGLAALATGLVLYGVHTFVHFDEIY